MECIQTENRNDDLIALLKRKFVNRLRWQLIDNKEFFTEIPHRQITMFKGCGKRKGNPARVSLYAQRTRTRKGKQGMSETLKNQLAKCLPHLAVRQTFLQSCRSGTFLFHFGCNGNQVVGGKIKIHTGQHIALSVYVPGKAGGYLFFPL